MAIVYRVYSNQGTGGPVDFAAPVATVPGLSYTGTAAGLSTDTTFVVRAYDTVADLEEANTEARVRLIVDADGVDVTGRPNPPHALSLSPAFGGGCRVNWAHAAGESLTRPDGFRVYLAAGNSADVTVVSGSVPYVVGRLGYSLTLPAPLAPARYTAAVRSFNASGESAMECVTSSLGLSAEPFVMERLTAQATP